jgi:hypothetical protein
MKCLNYSKRKDLMSIAASTEELIDACVEMIEKLHKQKLL